MGKPENSENMRPTKSKKRKKLVWMTKTIAEETGREEVLRTTLTETIIYIFFIIFATIYIMGHRNFSMFYLNEALLKEFVHSSFLTLNGIVITFDQIKSASDFWGYIEDRVADSFFWDEVNNTLEKQNIEGRNMILYENQLLGVPRIRQVRVRNDSCEIFPSLRRLFLTCYSDFDDDGEDMSPYGFGKGTAWTYSDSSATESLSYRGEVGFYNGGGFFQDFSTDKNETMELINTLKENLWITRGTRAVFIDFSVYNVNNNLFAICKIVFEFPPSGGVIPSAHFRTAKLIILLDSWDWFVFVCQGLFYIMVIFYLCEEIREAMYFKWKYLLHFWTWINVLIIILSFVTAFLSWRIYVKLPETMHKIKKNPNKYGNLEYLLWLYISDRDSSAVVLYLVYIKIFKYLNFSRTMGQLNNTIKRCARDVLGFSFMFFIVFIAFSELGYLLFGGQVKGFKGFGVSMFTLLRTILGDFDYEEMEHANRVLAPIFFFTYIFLVFFVLLNMFLAIINDTYVDVKTEIAIAPKEMQMTDYIKIGLYKMLNKCGWKLKFSTGEKKHFNITVSKIRDALKKCGFNDSEIEMFFNRYEIDPLTELTEHDIDKFMAAQKQMTAMTAHPEDYVLVKDFMTQEDKLDQIEENITQLAGKVQILLETLEKLDNVKKTKKSS